MFTCSMSWLSVESRAGGFRHCPHSSRDYQSSEACLFYPLSNSHGLNVLETGSHQPPQSCLPLLTSVTVQIFQPGPPRGAEWQRCWNVMDVLKAPGLTRELQNRGCHHMNHWTSCCHCQQLQVLDIFFAHCSRLAPSGVPTQSSPLLPSDACTENAHSAPFAQLKVPQQLFPEGVALSVPQEAKPISQTESQPSQSCASCNSSLTFPAVPGADGSIPPSLPRAGSSSRVRRAGVGGWHCHWGESGLWQ